jgi:hypothetical protein
MPRFGKAAEAWIARQRDAPVSIPHMENNIYMPFPLNHNCPDETVSQQLARKRA